MTGFYGAYKGIVTNSADPEGMLRIKALVPQVFGSPTAETDWALACVPPGFTGEAPVPGQGVWIAFEGGDTDYPLWIGVWNP